MSTTQSGQGVPLARDQLMRLGGSVPDEVDVGVALIYLLSTP
jgi:hypothetical protein